ncbi:hypothetical protein SK128_009202, partial [Halocaridina rubra]
VYGKVPWKDMVFQVSQKEHITNNQGQAAPYFRSMERCPWKDMVFQVSQQEHITNNQGQAIPYFRSMERCHGKIRTFFQAARGCYASNNILETTKKGKGDAMRTRQ